MCLVICKNYKTQLATALWGLVTHKKTIVQISLHSKIIQRAQFRPFNVGNWVFVTVYLWSTGFPCCVQSHKAFRQQVGRNAIIYTQYYSPTALLFSLMSAETQRLICSVLDFCKPAAFKKTTSWFCLELLGWIWASLDVLQHLGAILKSAMLKSEEA